MPATVNQQTRQIRPLLLGFTLSERQGEETREVVYEEINIIKNVKQHLGRRWSVASEVPEDSLKRGAP